MTGRPLLLAAAGLAAGCGGSDEANRADAGSKVADQLAAVEVRPGLWDVSSEIVDVRQPGLPHEVAGRMKGRRRAFRHCITPEEAARPDANFLAGRDAASCTQRSFEMRGGRIEGAMTCSDPAGAETRARMSGRYGPESYEMRMEMETPGIGRDVTMTLVTRQAGRRVGDCPEGGDETQ